ncbi:hypothetical protein JCM8097_005582 [Rhodosporidiobolus ruineniae]
MHPTAPLSRSASPATEFPFPSRPSATPRRSSLGPRAHSQSPSSSSAAGAGLSADRLVQLFKGDEEQARNHEQEQRAFADKREHLVEALDETTGLVKSLAAFNQNKWTVHYPHSLGVSNDPPATPQRSGSAPPQQTPTRSKVAGRHGQLRRSLSLADEEVVEARTAEGVERPSPQRALTMIDEAPAPSPTKDATPSTPAHPLSILSLDLRQGHGSAAATASLPALLPSLTLQTLSQLLSRRLTASLSHISSLRTRVLDHKSRILVTGDLNAGKSTFINALLRREVMPWDQQPCTTVFTEVIDADVNDGKEELHAIRDAAKYDREDSATFDVYQLDEIYDVQDTGDAYYIVKAYVKDNRDVPEGSSEEHSSSLLKNELVDISLIDAPGLNRDNTSTTALFARQPEIDVIVFVVSAENHFTLSAQEFLKETRREKAHVFIVVNKWGGIRDKARCMRLVGEQIKELSPTTWENRQELVHFVDAADYVDEEGKPAEVKEGEEEEKEDAFDHLEQSLRSFVCLKRSKSKLAPAKHYLLNLLADLSTLASTNTIAASDELASALRDLERIRPVHERLSAQRDEVEDGVDRVEESVVETVKAAAWSRLERALSYIQNGEVVPPSPSSAVDADRPQFSIPDSFPPPTELPAYPGVWGIWEWAADVKKTLVRALEAEVRAAEDEARSETAEGVHVVVNELGNKYLPEEVVEASLPAPSLPTAEAKKDGEEQQVAPSVPARQARVFRPEVMFYKRRRGVGRLAARGLSPGLGLGAAGAGVNWSATDFDVSVFDLFDFERMMGHSHLFSATGAGGKGKSAEEDIVETGTLVGLGLGSLGMVGSRVIGIKGTMESLAKMVEVLGSKQARKWAGPVIGVLTVGLVVYVIVDLPRAIPRNIGRKLALSLSSTPCTDLVVSSPSSSTPAALPVTFSSAHSDRIAREARKVLRLAGWDLRERFRAALDRSAAERKEVEGVVARAEAALQFLEEFEGQVEREEEKVREVQV